VFSIKQLYEVRLTPTVDKCPSSYHCCCEHNRQSATLLFGYERLLGEKNQTIRMTNYQIKLVL